jgi:hypothetical protein
VQALPRLLQGHACCRRHLFRGPQGQHGSCLAGVDALDLCLLAAGVVAGSEGSAAWKTTSAVSGLSPGLGRAGNVSRSFKAGGTGEGDRLRSLFPFSKRRTVMIAVGGTKTMRTRGRRWKNSKSSDASSQTMAKQYNNQLTRGSKPAVCNVIGPQAVVQLSILSH